MKCSSQPECIVTPEAGSASLPKRLTCPGKPFDREGLVADDPIVDDSVAGARSPTGHCAHLGLEVPPQPGQSAQVIASSARQAGQDYSQGLSEHAEQSRPSYTTATVSEHAPDQARASMQSSETQDKGQSGHSNADSALQTEAATGPSARNPASPASPAFKADDVLVGGNQTPALCCEMAESETVCEILANSRRSDPVSPTHSAHRELPESPEDVQEDLVDADAGESADAAAWGSADASLSAGIPSEGLKDKEYESDKIADEQQLLDTEHSAKKASPDLDASQSEDAVDPEAAGHEAASSEVSDPVPFHPTDGVIEEGTDAPADLPEVHAEDASIYAEPHDDAHWALADVPFCAGVGADSLEPGSFENALADELFVSQEEVLDGSETPALCCEMLANSGRSDPVSPTHSAHQVQEDLVEADAGESADAAAWGSADASLSAGTPSEGLKDKEYESDKIADEQQLLDTEHSAKKASPDLDASQSEDAIDPEAAGHEAASSEVSDPVPFHPTDGVIEEGTDAPADLPEVHAEDASIYAEPHDDAHWALADVPFCAGVGADSLEPGSFENALADELFVSQEEVLDGSETPALCCEMLANSGRSDPVSPTHSAHQVQEDLVEADAGESADAAAWGSADASLSAGTPSEGLKDKEYESDKIADEQQLLDTEHSAKKASPDLDASQSEDAVDPEAAGHEAASSEVSDPVPFHPTDGVIEEGTDAPTDLPEVHAEDASIYAEPHDDAHWALADVPFCAGVGADSLEPGSFENALADELFVSQEEVLDGSETPALCCEMLANSGRSDPVSPTHSAHQVQEDLVEADAGESADAAAWGSADASLSAGTPSEGLKDKEYESDKIADEQQLLDTEHSAKKASPDLDASQSEDAVDPEAAGHEAASSEVSDPVPFHPTDGVIEEGTDAPTVLPEVHAEDASIYAEPHDDAHWALAGVPLCAGVGADSLEPGSFENALADELFVSQEEVLDGSETPALCCEMLANSSRSDPVSPTHSAHQVQEDLVDADAGESADAAAWGSADASLSAGTPSEGLKDKEYESDKIADEQQLLDIEHSAKKASPDLDASQSEDAVDPEVAGHEAASSEVSDPVPFHPTDGVIEEGTDAPTDLPEVHAEDASIYAELHDDAHWALAGVPLCAGVGADSLEPGSFENALADELFVSQEEVLDGSETPALCCEMLANSGRSDPVSPTHSAHQVQEDLVEADAGESADAAAWGSADASLSAGTPSEGLKDKEYESDKIADEQQLLDTEHSAKKASPDLDASQSEDAVDPEAAGHEAASSEVSDPVPFHPTDGVIEEGTDAPTDLPEVHAEDASIYAELHDDAHWALAGVPLCAGVGADSLEPGSFENALADELFVSQEEVLVGSETPALCCEMLANSGRSDPVSPTHSAHQELPESSEEVQEDLVEADAGESADAAAWGSADASSSAGTPSEGLKDEEYESDKIADEQQLLDTEHSAKQASPDLDASQSEDAVDPEAAGNEAASSEVIYPVPFHPTDGVIEEGTDAPADLPEVHAEDASIYAEPHDDAHWALADVPLCAGVGADSLEPGSFENALADELFVSQEEVLDGSETPALCCVIAESDTIGEKILANSGSSDALSPTHSTGENANAAAAGLADASLATGIANEISEGSEPGKARKDAKSWDDVMLAMQANFWSLDIFVEEFHDGQSQTQATSQDHDSVLDRSNESEATPGPPQALSCSVGAAEMHRSREACTGCQFPYSMQPNQVQSHGCRI